jgi:glycosyltransferase involved in cell wall biosynthesis
VRVRYYGHVGQRTGYGRAAEATCHALMAAGVDLDIRPLAPRAQLDLTRSSALPLASLIQRHEGTPADMMDVVIVHTLPLDTPRVLAIERLAKGAGPKLVAYTTWEGESAMPIGFRKAFNAFDAVCFPSTHNLERLPVDLIPDRPYHSDEFRAFVVPHAIINDWAPPDEQRAPSSGFAFYYVGAWSGRKNPAGLIRAFASEFDRHEGVSLTLYCAGASQADFACAMTATGLPQDAHPRITLVDRFVPDVAIEELHATPGCFVTATRGEAWNYPAFDAMMARRAVIAPVNMGHDDFLHDTSARSYGGVSQPAEMDVRVGDPVPGQSERALNLRVAGAQGLDCRATWIEPDLRVLAAQMRRCYQRDERNLTVTYDAAARYSTETVGKNLLTELESL